MFRWHESACSKPSVIIVGGLPWCQTCCAVPPPDEDINNHDTLRLPPPPSRQRRHLEWPKGVKYDKEEETDQDEDSRTDQIDAGRRVRSASVDKFSFTQTRCNAIHTVEHESCYPILPPRSIRILDITPGERDDILHGKFRIVQLDMERSHYEALSYTWADAAGDSQRCRTIYIGPFWDVVLITRNCEDALRSVRPRNNKLMQHTLWIDAVCVNQNDIVERTSQVALMPEIYSGAAGVLVYLGPATESSTIGLEAISHSLSTNDCCHSPGKATCQDCRAAIVDLFKRPYFGRLWVVQEILLSKSITLYCGALAASLPFSKILELSPEDAWMARRARGALHAKCDLLSLMVETGDCACKDPRDKVFALLGIPSDWPGDQILPDYSLSLDEVAIGIASYFIQVCKLAWPVLMVAGQKRDKAKILPSWVPDIETSFKSPGIHKHLCDQLLGITNRHYIWLYPRYFNYYYAHLWGFKMLRFQKRVDQKEIQPRAVPDFCPLIFRNQTQKEIRITSSLAHLKVFAIRLCNVRQAFKLKDVDYDDDIIIMKPAREPKTRSHLLMMSTPSISPRLFIQKPQNSPPYRTRLSDFIGEQDELYWLSDAECYAILRPESSCSLHTLVCISDLKIQCDVPEQTGSSWCLVLRPMEPEDIRHVRHALEAIFDETHQTLSEADDEMAVVKLAIRLIRENYLWDAWKACELEWYPVLADSAILDHFISALETSALRTLKDGERSNVASETAPDAIEKPRSVAALLWSIVQWSMDKLPSYGTRKKGALTKDWDISSIYVNLNKWATITDDLIASSGDDDLDLRSTANEYPEKLNDFRGYQHRKWHYSWNRFRRETGLDETIWDTTGGILYVLNLQQKLHAAQHPAPSIYPRLVAQRDDWNWKYMEDRPRSDSLGDVSWIFSSTIPRDELGCQLRLRLEMHAYGLNWTSGTDVTIK